MARQKRERPNTAAKPFADGVAMLEQLQPDAVSICTPPKFRIPFVEAAAKHGIAVLCEKPPARTLAETQRHR